LPSFLISFTGSNLELAKWVDKALHTLGHDTTVQLADFAAGNNFVAKMHEALEVNETVVLLMSEEALASEWALEEWTSAERLSRSK